MKINLESLEVIHNEAERRFEIWVDNRLSKMDYILHSDTIVMTHVGVDPELRGQGVAAKLVEAGIHHAEKNSLRVVPMCSYAAAYIRRHPEYAELTKQKIEE